MTNLTYAIEYINEVIEEMEYMIFHEGSKELVAKLNASQLKLECINETICDILYNEIENDENVSTIYYDEEYENEVVIELSRFIFNEVDNTDPSDIIDHELNNRLLTQEYYASVL